MLHCVRQYSLSVSELFIAIMRVICVGVFKGVEDFNVYVDVKHIPELYKIEVC